MPDIGKLFPSRYLKVGDLDGREVTVTIKGVKMENVGQTKELRPVIYFKGTNKGMVLNVTNSKRIAKITNSSDTDDWSGHKIILYPSETEFQGETVECLRVKGQKKDAAVEAINERPAKKARGGKKSSEPEPDDPMPVDVEEQEYAPEPEEEEEEDPIPFDPSRSWKPPLRAADIKW